MIDGADIVVRNVIATAFGGGFDRGDNGQTESGIRNDGSNPKLLGCALPIRSIEAATKGSPLAFPGQHIPWGTLVKVWREDPKSPDGTGEASAITLQLIDNGPDQEDDPTHAIDITVYAAHHFAPQIALEDLANDFEQQGFSFRILGAARYALAA